MVTLSHHLEYADLQRLREGRRERLEVIDGELFVNPAPSPLHQFVSKRLCHIFMQAVDDAGIGEYLAAPVDVVLTNRDIVQPDLVVLLRSNLSRISNRAIEGPPDLVVEIISPSSDFHDRVRKQRLYARHGVSELWLVDPVARQLTIYANPCEGRYHVERAFTDTAVSTIIPGLTVDLMAVLSPVPTEQDEG
ncbi:MAG: Uma2 family endonuclease [Thermomicrobiales bacterium]